MAEAVQDTRLRDGFGNVISQAEQLEVDGNLATIRDAAVADAKVEVEAFAKIIEREDLKEVTRMEAESGVAEARRVANHSYTATRSALETGLAIKRASNDDSADREARDAEAYLDRVQASEFKAMSYADALASLKRTHSYLDKLVPDELAAPVKAIADPALTAYEEAIATESKAQGKWVAAQAELEAARKQTRDAYLTFRDHMRGILRTLGRLDKLNQLAPPLDNILNTTRTPTPEPTPEPVPQDE